jgi:hypothetical protein
VLVVLQSSLSRPRVVDYLQRCQSECPSATSSKISQMSRQRPSQRYTAHDPGCPGAHAAPSRIVIDPVSWTQPTSSKRYFGDGGGNSDRGAPVLRYSAIGAARRVAVKKVRTRYTTTLTNRRCMCNKLYRKHVYHQGNECLLESSREYGSCCIGAGGTFGSPSGCPQ